MKINKKLLVITTIIILIPVIIGLLLWEQLPAEIPVHWGADNQPDGWAGKTFAVFGIPVLLAALHVFGLFITFADPKKNNIGKKAIGLIYWIVPAISLFAMSASYAFALEKEVNIGMICYLLIGIIFVILGNYLPKAKQNYTFGYKIPWTLNSEENWNKTHRLAGWIMVASGIILIINAFFLLEWVLVAVAVLALIPIVYSYLLFKKGI